jgi:hypothetical protein
VPLGRDESGCGGQPIELPITVLPRQNRFFAVIAEPGPGRPLLPEVLLRWRQERRHRRSLDKGLPSEATERTAIWVSSRSLAHRIAHREIEPLIVSPVRRMLRYRSVGQTAPTSVSTTP